MKNKIRAVILLLAVISLYPEAFAGIPGEVTANKLNVRIKPGTKFSIVAKLKEGDKVNVLAVEKDWYKITAPADSSVWVSRPFINGDEIIRRVNLRCGPSVAYNKYTTVDPGLKIRILDDSNPDWVKIAPPTELQAYVAKKYIRILPLPKTEKTEQEKMKLTMSYKPADKSETAAEKSLPKAKDLNISELLKFRKKEKSGKSRPYINEREKIVTFQGILLPLVKPTPLATHCIAIKIHNEYIKTCYITTSRYNLKLWENKKVNIKGVQHWVKGWVLPIIEAQRIRPIWN